MSLFSNTNSIPNEFPIVYDKEYDKGTEFCHKLLFPNLYICATRCCIPLIFQTMNSVRSKCLSLKYNMFTPSGCKDIGIRKFDCVVKTQFLSLVTAVVYY